MLANRKGKITTQGGRLERQPIEWHKQLQRLRNFEHVQWWHV